MAVWRRLGDIIAHNMVFLVPLCLVFGVCAPDAFAVLKPLVTPMFAFPSSPPMDEIMKSMTCC